MKKASSFGTVSSASLTGHGFGSAPLLPPSRTTTSTTTSTTTTTAATRSAILLAVCMFLSSTVAAQTLPYIPTNIFIPAPRTAQTQQDGTADIAYIFSPQDDDSVDLLALNLSKSLKASSFSFKTLSSGLPFLDGNNTAFTPSLADNGSLIVYAGDCSSSNTSGIWTFTSSTNDDASAQWVQQSTTISTADDTLQTGPGFLGSSFSFSTTLEPQTSEANTYVYGGMCPDSTLDYASPQGRATYSNQMVKVAPSDSSIDGYTVTPVSSKGPPVAEAGFTFTGLYPSISNHSGMVTQQVNYVLLGGHTQWAFVNMSTVAIWNLPEESWAFVSDIGLAASSTSGTDLAVESAVSSIDSRSGHTALLNEDGTSLIILGGWVGDLTQAASPQLAILEVGSGYGGEGDWQWSVPDTQPSAGIYGHGAALLPGNVMMVYGGYSISSSGNKFRRQGSAGTPTFLNLTSMTWSDDYTNPSYNANVPDGDSDDLSEKTKQHLGLGLGLGLGGVAIIAAVLVYIYYRRRLRDRRLIRDSQIRELAQDDSRFLGHEDEMMEHDQGGSWYMGGADPYAQGSRSLGYQSLQTNRGSMDNSRQHWFGDMPPIQPVARKPVAPRSARGQYQPMPAAVYDPYDPAHNSRGPGGMNPIYEADEDDALQYGGGNIVGDPISPLRDAHRDSGQYSNPFVSPVHERPLSFPPPSRASASPSPEDRRRNSATDPEVQDWMFNLDAADALLRPRPAAGGAGRPSSSPTRRNTVRSTRSLGGHTAENDEGGSRTGSNISESNRSNLSPSRSGSVRSHLRVGFGMAAAAAGIATEDRGGTSSSSSSAPTYNTAKSSFPTMQAEGPTLLMGRDRDEEEMQEPGSPSKNKPRRSWFGSLRRVFSGPTPSPSSGESMDRDEGDPFRDSMAEASDYDARRGGLGGIAADGLLLRRKGGRGAWEGQGRGRPGSGRGSYAQLGTGGAGAGAGDLGDGEDHDDDDDWDIERAVEQRLVQVMFTVPKERLRVVNAEPEMEWESGEDVVVVDPARERAAQPQEEGRREGPAVAQHHPGLAVPLSQPEPRRPEPIPAAEPERIQPAGLGLQIPLATWTTAADSIPTPSPVSENWPMRRDDPEKEALRRELDAEWARAEAEAAEKDMRQQQQTVLDQEIEKLGLELQRDNERARARSREETPEHHDHLVDRAPEPETEPEPEPKHLIARNLDIVSRDVNTSSSSSEDDAPAPLTPRSDRKPRSRVLAMVEHLESKSREGSPSTSPTRGSPLR
ncbi:Uu.00g017520.m01.CDS01 [Anthostomella pinea]|uniref:Uu.00g017520.m01.CDS01 n=1 Tax=Anthostomella pinea TaxID=933095 RepID=A0AAI8W050_9PEZI|nr:Uu.00g017520.m01.CDS01 [Anthostomella pinea]